ncbi:hypothetical protein NC653_032914 [Populus alba x Populus x berolinensis]|uniref:Uncharacterized protein n=1 Tax=Populus alba x Populus x berolinensis TaxID=444605 RepID=A0AAD6PYI3_9ROSI|nr:hypothetical protein NC653_032914 [Populus alba x Populus x berolinensis]
MIYRKWSLLTGPVVILGGIMGTAVAVRVLFFENSIGTMIGERVVGISYDEDLALAIQEKRQCLDFPSTLFCYLMQQLVAGDLLLVILFSNR